MNAHCCSVGKVLPSSAERSFARGDDAIAFTIGTSRSLSAESTGVSRFTRIPGSYASRSASYRSPPSKPIASAISRRIPTRVFSAGAKSAKSSALRAALHAESPLDCASASAFTRAPGTFTARSRSQRSTRTIAARSGSASLRERLEQLAERGVDEALVVEALQGRELRGAGVLRLGREVRLLVPGGEAVEPGEVAQLLHPREQAVEGCVHRSNS